ncbi:Pre-mRNA-splicing factor brr2 [Leucoagaricus sp. SymC.cos]|nr:Pre-mRNA-splicing factor brr2 [Leucoagaricus sp. SymC.cos]
MQSDADERVNIGVAMREKGVGWILRELAGDKQTKESNTMDVDETKSGVPKTATLAPSPTVQPKRVLDLETMAFSLGSHLMSNKKVKLLEGSFKHAKKGSEGIHVLASKSEPVTDAELVVIPPLPAWAREAFTANIAMLTVLNEHSKWRNEETGKFDLDGFKIIYITPMKTLI